MTDTDIKTGKDMLKEDFILKNPQWHAELQMMIKRKEKAEIRTLKGLFLGISGTKNEVLALRIWTV